MVTPDSGPAIKLMVSTVKDEQGRHDLFYELAEGTALSVGRIDSWRDANRIARRFNSQKALVAVVEGFMRLSGKPYRNDPNALLSALDAMLPAAQRALPEEA